MLIDQTLEEFGNGIGMPGLALDDTGKVVLNFESMGILFFEKVEPESHGDPDLLIYLAKDHGVDPGELAVAALRACHFKMGHSQPVNPGIAGDNRLVFATRLEENEVSLPAIENSLQLLDSLHESLNQ